jgi:hypothetical protein
LITFPINLYLWWKVLHLVGATELMWFLFWVNWPLVILITIIDRILKDSE